MDEFRMGRVGTTFTLYKEPPKDEQHFGIAAQGGNQEEVLADAQKKLSPADFRVAELAINRYFN